MKNRQVRTLRRRVTKPGGTHHGDCKIRQKLPRKRWEVIRKEMKLKKLLSKLAARTIFSYFSGKEGD